MRCGKIASVPQHADDHFPPPRRVATNGIELAVHTSGDGPAIVLLHGFPELAYSWRHQIAALVEAGYRVIAPDQRGYATSDAPADPTAYSMRALVADTVGLLDHFDVERAVVVGHDFGGMLAWHAAVYAPDRIAAVASLCTPHGPRGRTDVVESYRRRYGDAHYMTTFQQLGLAESVFEADLPRTFEQMLRRVGVTLAEFRRMPAVVQALPMGLFIGEPQLMGAPLVGEAELAVYVEAYRTSGFRGPLSWYRSLATTWLESEGVDMTVRQPALFVQAADDVFLATDQGDLTGQFTTDLERHVIADCGHWIQQERPEAVNDLLLSWLRRRVTTIGGFS
jgi:soluble epoxide hydrolase/lipid-phosphate phosphatase